MRRTILLLTLIAAASSLALGQTNVKSVGYLQNNKSSAAAQCSGASLSVKVGDTDAAMGGERMVTYSFTNKSTSPCTLNGYPHVELLNRKGTVGRRATNSKELG